MKNVVDVVKLSVLYCILQAFVVNEARLCSMEELRFTREWT